MMQKSSFRDLPKKMPDSSDVHSYLAKVLEARGDERATAGYATAVHLDPTNQDALRSYAGYLISLTGTTGGALPVLRATCSNRERNPRTYSTLMRTLLGIGDAG